jgi:type I site-specific restriction endonuclease
VAVEKTHFKRQRSFLTRDYRRQLADQGWNTQDQNSVRYEYILPDGSRAGYVLCDRHGRSMGVIEAKRFSISPGDATEQAKSYTRQLGVQPSLSGLPNGKHFAITFPMCFVDENEHVTTKIFSLRKAFLLA